MGIGVKFSNMGSKIDVKIKDEDSCAKVDSNSAVYIRGEDGDDGATFYPEMSEDGTLSWTNDKELENPEPINIKGPPGDQGIQGPQGPAGKDGYTPVKGKDYFTKEEVADIARAASELVEVPETAKDAVLYIKQKLTDKQRTQARTNIGSLGYNWHTIYEDDSTSIQLANYNENYPISNWESGLKVASKNGLYGSALGEFLYSIYYIFRTDRSTSASKIKLFVDAGKALIKAGVLVENSIYMFACTTSTQDAPIPEKIAFVFVEYVNSRKQWQVIDTAEWRFKRAAVINSDYTIAGSTLDTVDKTLTQTGHPADARTVGKALELKIDKSEIATDDEILEMLAEIDMFPVVTDSDGALLSDENENILLW